MSVGPVGPSASGLNILTQAIFATINASGQIPGQINASLAQRDFQVLGSINPQSGSASSGNDTRSKKSSSAEGVRGRVIDITI